MAATATQAAPASGILARPIAPTGLWSWLTTIDHKRIGILYGTSAFIFFLIGGIEALLMRTQLARPDATLVSPGQFNALFTMHGTTMVFLVIMPLSAAFFNYIVPLQIGARDVAFPRLNAFSYWVFLSGAILLHLSFVVGMVPDVGWFAYAPNTMKQFSPNISTDFWIVGLQVLGVGTLAAGFNFLVTILQLRAPGMSLMRMPLFTWTTFITSILIVLAFPPLAVALVALMFDRLFGTGFYNPAVGGQAILWQHVFWVFGHPEVYILILPAMGIVSEILPVFSRKPLFGYSFMVYAVAAIGFLSFTVWAHHMFTTGLGPIAVAFFTASTMLIAVPTGIKIFNWISTLYRGSIRFTTANLCAIAFIAMFTIGGLSGVMHASPPVDGQHQDTYYVVAHFHYVLFGGAIFGLFGGIYFWFPKFTGRMLSETLGALHFWLFFVGFNLTFGPMHFLGVDGMPRRIFTYSSNMQWDLWNMVATIGAFTLGLGVMAFMANVLWSLAKGDIAGGDPWDGMTLEWSIPSPPPHYNFATIPTVLGRDTFWLTKHPELLGHDHGAPASAVAHLEAAHDDHDAHQHIHMPDPSYWPLIAASGLLVAGLGILLTAGTGMDALWSVVALGLFILTFGIFGWSLEPVNG